LTVQNTLDLMFRQEEGIVQGAVSIIQFIERLLACLERVKAQVPELEKNLEFLVHQCNTLVTHIRS